MPSTAAAQQVYRAAIAKRLEADFSVLILFMEELAGMASTTHATATA